MTKPQKEESCQGCIFFKKKVCSGAVICPVPRSRPAKESSDKVLDELEKRVEENGSLYLQASAFFRWIKELRTKER